MKRLLTYRPLALVCSVFCYIAFCRHHNSKFGWLQTTTEAFEIQSMAILVKEVCYHLLRKLLNCVKKCG